MQLSDDYTDTPKKEKGKFFENQECEKLSS